MESSSISPLGQAIKPPPHPWASSISPLGQAIEPPPHPWASIIGVLIAVLTITVPLLAIANYSSPTKPEALPPHRSTLSQPQT